MDAEDRSIAKEWVFDACVCNLAGFSTLERSVNRLWNSRRRKE